MVTALAKKQGTVTLIFPRQLLKLWDHCPGFNSSFLGTHIYIFLSVTGRLLMGVLMFGVWGWGAAAWLVTAQPAQGSGQWLLLPRWPLGLLKQSSLLTASLEMCHRNKAVAHQREVLLSLLHNPLILFMIKP